jgi:hypothetical protein
MKSLLIAIALMPVVSMASVYNCNGSGFDIDVTGNPLEMKIVGNGFNSISKNVSASSTFDTVFTGNTTNPAATVKLTIKDSSFGNPGDNFKSDLQVSSAAGIKDYAGLNCIRGND